MSRLNVNRRKFLKTGAGLAGAAFFISGTKASGNILGANDTIHAAVAGIKSRGGSHISACVENDKVQLIYLVDPDARLFDSRSKSVEDKRGKAPKCEQDIRRVLEDKDVDVVMIATPNHWHSLMTVWACQADKDVYVEKPLSHNIHEGRIAAETARKYNRIVQHGSQNRSSRRWQQIAQIAQDGTYGKLLVSRGLCYKRRDSIGEQPTKTPPDSLAYDLWLGPAQETPYHENLVHYNWHWFWDFGNGDIGNQGIHQMDIARWMLPDNATPKSVLSLGGRFGYEDQGETPNTQVALIDYGDQQIIFEVRGLETDKYYDQGVGNVLHFEEGVVANNKFHPKNGGEPQDLPDRDVKMGPGDGHFENFFAAVRSRNSSDLNAEVLKGHLSCIPVHMANVSYRLGKEVAFEKKSDPFKGNAAAQETFDRMKEHLAQNNVKWQDMSYRLGRYLEFDAKSETFKDAPEANALISRDYRIPFVVPERVA